MKDMVTWFRKTILCAMVLSISTALLADELHFGSPSPRFSATMMRGEPIGGITKGTIYVIEFVGTKCVPCIKFIPEMNILQERYPNVTFISVFCESLDAVKPFMDGPGKAMRVRVATDESGHMRKEWLDPGGLQGIPQAFIVDRSGSLAWFGCPAERKFGEILKKIVDGTYDGRLEYMRMELKRKTEEKERELFRWVEKVNEVSRRAYACETPEESIEVIDKSLPLFAGSPERIKLSIMKLNFYKELPQSREQAYRHALSLAVEAVYERNPHSYVYACEAMLSHSEFALPENRDSRLTDLALAVLLDETAPTNHVKVDSDTEIDCQVERLVAIANARRLRGERSIALEGFAEAISILRNRDRKGRPQWWMDSQQELLRRLEARLAD